MVEEQFQSAPAQVAALAVRHREARGLVLLPESLAPRDGVVVAGFREDAQELRVAALERGIDVSIAIPDGARPGVYHEHTADWVLPLVLSVPSQILASLFVKLVEKRIDAWQSSRPMIAKYQEVVITRDETAIRSVELPAPDLLVWLRERERASGAPAPGLSRNPDSDG